MVDSENPESYLINTKGRSSEWKENVLRNFVSAKYPVNIDKKGSHNLTVKVNQTGIVIDQIAVYLQDTNPFYEFRK